MMYSVKEPEELRELPISELLKRLSQETALLIRQEIELAKAEVSEKAKHVGKGAGMFGTAGMIALLALGALTACLILALSTAMAAWLAALIVTIVYGIVAFICLQTGKQKLKQAAPLAPTQTLATIKEDVEWAKIRAASARR